MTDCRNIITPEDTRQQEVEALAFRDGVDVLQSSLGRLEGEEGRQAQHAVKPPDFQHALLHLEDTHTSVTLGPDPSDPEGVWMTHLRQQHADLLHLLDGEQCITGRVLEQHV